VNSLLSSEGILKDLNEAQRYAVCLGDGPILVIAGAGTGKTRTLVHRVAWLVNQGVPASSILLLTFTRRAAAEMLERARNLDPACQAVEGGTFHSLAHRLLRRYGPWIELSPRFSVIDQADTHQIIKGVVAEGGLKDKSDRRFPKPRTLADLISKSRNLELSLEETLEIHSPHLLSYLDQIQIIARGFNEAKRTQDLVDYDDLLFLSEKLLDDHAQVRRELGQRWRHILVDEYQDTNAVQARLLKLLCSQHQNVMVVGDDAQSIYAFRGARLRNIFEFPHAYKDVRLVKLTQNYRSTQNILDLTNSVIAQALERYEKDLFTERDKGVKPQLLRPREQRGQSRQAVERIRELMAKGAHASEIAVLFRAGRDSFDLENELRAERLLFVKYGGIRFVELAHVKDVMAHLRVVANPRDFLSWQRILMLLPKVGPKTAQQIIGHLVKSGSASDYIPALDEAPQVGRIPQLVQLSGLLKTLSKDELTPLEMVETVLEYYEPICVDSFEDYPRRLTDLKELPALASQTQTLAEFLAETVLDPPEGEGDLLEAEPLTLSTTHSAKGKEWPHVIIIWATDGRFPGFPSLDDPQALEEERRLMYVACTRAGATLTIMAPKEHYYEGTGWRPEPLSRFLDDLPQGLLESQSIEPVFAVPEPAPASRGTRKQKRPFEVGQKVNHAKFGAGKVMGYKGDSKIFVHFKQFGLKTLVIEFANLTEQQG
jgi:DNA helicase-2/ATP-dependent DNA helicase PcrA